MTDANMMLETAIRTASYLWNTGRGKEAVQLLEDIVASGGFLEFTDDDVARMLPSVKQRLGSLHYRWAQHVDPTTGVRATPTVRIAHLSRCLELGFRFGYIYKCLAEAHHYLGDDEQARAYLKQAWEVDPNLSGAVRIARP